MNKIIVLASLAAFSFTGQAAENRASVSHMQSYTAEFDYFAVQEDGTLSKAGQWTDSVDIDDGRIVRTVTRRPLGGGVDLVRAVAADSVSLAPLHMTQRFGPGLAGVYHSQLQGEKLTQVLITDEQTPARIQSSQLPVGLVEVNLQGIFAAALPLDAGSRISVEGYRGGAQPAAEEQLFEVLGQESVTLNGDHVPAWKVYQAQTDWTYWVRKEPPYLLKVSHPSPGGGMLVSYLVHYDL